MSKHREKLASLLGVAEALVEFLEKTNECLDSKDIHKAIIEMTAKAFECNKVIIYLIKEQNIDTEIKVVKALGINKKPDGIQDVKIGGVDINYCNNLRTISCEGIKLTYYDNAEEIIKPAFAFPLITEERLLGLISVGKLFDNNTETYVRLISSAVASILTHALKIENINVNSLRIEKIHQELNEKSAGIKNISQELEKKSEELRKKNKDIAGEEKKRKELDEENKKLGKERDDYKKEILKLKGRGFG